MLYLLLILFSASGCAALIYEVVWYQLLQLVIGSTSVSMGILLATFMGGLCIGSLWLPRRWKKQHPLKIYAALELGIAAFAISVKFLIPVLSRVYFAGASRGFADMLLRGLLAALCMLPPTILMGASLPAIVRWVKSAPWWGFLYGGNTAGAVLGSLLAGFYLLRVYNLSVATWVAAGINVVVAAISYIAASRFTGPPVSEAPSTTVHGDRWPIYLCIALSGATALGAEVVWTRTLGMLLLATVYVFSIILAVFLAGLAIGSAAGSWIAKKGRAQAALGWSQVLLMLGMAWTAYTMIHVLPVWSDDVLTTQDGWHMYTLDLKRCLWAILPPTLFWGASFPLACAAAARPGEDPSRVSGSIYAANTLGGIVGALAVSLWLIPAIGTQHTEQLLLIVAGISGLVALFPLLRGSIGGVAGLIASVVLAVVLAMSIDPIPGELIAYGRRMGINAGQSQILYVKEGRNSSVAISQWNNGTIYVNVNGHVEATTEIYDMKLQRMVGHLPGMLHPNPKSVLGIGFGAGVSAGTFTRYPGIEKITICEIEPMIPPASTKYFGREDYQVALNPKTHIVFDDARHYLLTTNERFDIIASDPLDVFVKGTAALYSLEYFESVKRHLNPGGMFTLYVPLYETDEPTIKSELATFFAAFPYGTVWANTRDGLGYDMVFMGQIEPLRINVDEVQQRLDRPDYVLVRESLRGIGIMSMFDMLATYTGNADDLKSWIAGSQMNTDDDLRLSYLAGWGINSAIEDLLYRAMLARRRPPVEMLTGSSDRVQLLLSELGPR